MKLLVIFGYILLSIGSTLVLTTALLLCGVTDSRLLYAGGLLVGLVSGIYCSKDCRELEGKNDTDE
jgi:hypothetical protein